MPRLLSALILVFGLVCCGIALAHILAGPAIIPGSVPVNATMDSEDRFYATMFLGYGAAMAWCARNLRERAGPFRFLLALFFLSGLARIVSAIAVGLPGDFFLAMGALELLLPPVFWAWHRAALRQTA